MDNRSFEEEAREMFLADYSAELKQNGILRPTKNRDPICPPWLNLEYEAMEGDRAKYFLYYTAIHLAMKAWSGDDRQKHVMVVGAGRGRLVSFCCECLSEFNIPGTVHVIEVNSAANASLKEKFKCTPNVKVYEPLAVRTVEEIQQGIHDKACDSRLEGLISDKGIDLFVSELFGSFGDNEFVGEILSTCVELFSKRGPTGTPIGISIPKSYTTYICAIHSERLNKYFSGNPGEQLYVLGLPRDATFLSDIAEVYTQNCTTKKDDSTHCVKLTFEAKTKHLNLTGLAGYFRAQLFGELYIDTRPTAKQNTYFWESAFFPMPCTLPSCEDDKITFSLSRKCRPVKSSHILNINYPQLKMWYEWSLICSETNEKQVHNVNGTQHMLYL